jgi:3',5'-nucleoside bisphosphate phosphatase
MNLYRADLHIHTVLSPCGELEMSPANIIKQASEKALDIIGITDHNSTRHCRLIRDLAQSYGIFVLMGAEITTKEEVHCLAFFESDDQLDSFQHYLELHLPNIPNDIERFGYQVVLDRNEDIVHQEEWLLISAIDQSIDEVEKKVHSLNGLFIPAHIDKNRYSLISQLGFIPKGMNADAFELSAKANEKELQPYMKWHDNKPFIRSSDAHMLDLIGSCISFFEMESCSFSQIRNALLNGKVTTVQA